MQAWVAAQTEQVRGDQVRAEKRMNEQFGLLSAAAPEPKALTEDQQKLMGELFDQLVAVGNARKSLNQAAAPGGGADVKALESQTTELAARIEARRRELADAIKNAASGFTWRVATAGRPRGRPAGRRQCIRRMGRIQK